MNQCISNECEPLQGIAKYEWLLSNRKLNAWDRYILKRIYKKNQNFMALVVAPTGGGKSFSCMSVCEKLDPEFNTNRIYFSRVELMKDINSGKLKPGNAVIIEELGIQMGARSWQSKDNISYSRLMQTFRNLNLICLFNVPNLYFVDMHARELFHALWVVEEIDRIANQTIIAPKVIQMNPTKKNAYHKYLRVYMKNKWGLTKLVPLKKIRINKPSSELCAAYEKKKKAFTDNLNKDIESLGKKEEKDVKKYRVDYEAMDKLISEGYTNRKVAEIMKVHEITVCNHKRKLGLAKKINKTKQNKGIFLGNPPNLAKNDSLAV